jgi:hypothetical protein
MWDIQAVAWVDIQGGWPMNWHRALFRLWVGGAVAWVALLLAGALKAAIEAPQTNDRSELFVLAVISAVVGLFGAWVLRGFRKVDTR